ncbi:MAG: aldo/keto reductase [Lentisphaeria bacterium]|jgi:aryl-alcohol dehydrogenase-like predicted oxidoreductase|nr:aldo/keto reductase [Lentisphaeria bacterium]
MILTTIAGTAIRRLGLAGNPDARDEIVRAAATAGINFFFFYDLSYSSMTTRLRSLLEQHREGVIVATGSESRDVSELRTCLTRTREALGIDTIDIFFVEYVCPADDMRRVLGTDGVVSELAAWRARGDIRYVGVSVHDRDLSIELLQSGRIDVLMHRYNMAHRRSEDRVLPAAVAAGIPVIAFTCTRWGTLLRGHGDWGAERPVPSAAECYGFALSHPAVQVALTAPATVTQLQNNLGALGSDMPMSQAELKQWRDYGDLIYDDGTDEFETRWP